MHTSMSNIFRILHAGGYLGGGEVTNATHLISPNSGIAMEMGPDLPVATEEHCILKNEDKNKYMLTGGEGNEHKTWEMMFDMNVWVEGPEFSVSRDDHACGYIQDKDGTGIAVVAGNARTIKYIN